MNTHNCDLATELALNVALLDGVGGLIFDEGVKAFNTHGVDRRWRIIRIAVIVRKRPGFEVQKITMCVKKKRKKVSIEKVKAGVMSR